MVGLIGEISLSLSMEIRNARPEEATYLTELSFASKGYWKYPQSYFQRWRQELTITADYILANGVYVCVCGHTICGYYSLLDLQEDLSISGVVLKAGIWLEHMFVHPDNIGQRVGTRLFEHMRDVVQAQGLSHIHLLADPHARKFYEKMGCAYQGEYPSSIPGRTTPYLVYALALKGPTGSENG